MKMVVVTTITSTLDINDMSTSHTVDINDEDGLSEVSGDVLGTVVVSGLRATMTAVREKYPRAGQAADRADESEESK
jgi:ubiquinone biosynthesis protein UbiJ